MSATKNILVTGGNAGIGLALCRQLAADHGAKVFMGARNAERGAAGLKTILDAHPTADVELLLMDCADDASVSAAAAEMKAKGVSLYALVNNAGVGLGTGDSGASLLNINFYGPKRVTDAFLPMIDPAVGTPLGIEPATVRLPCAALCALDRKSVV